MKRCSWATQKYFYIHYHDTEWGVPVHDDRLHFEMLCLEGAQAGLSWETVLKKRRDYKKLFANFNPLKLSKISNQKLQEILKNPKIIRNKLKVFSVRKNAKVFLSIQKEYKTFDKYIWGYVNNKPIKNKWKDLKDIPAKTELSDMISKDLKMRGMTFVGSTIIYSYMQAIGMVNDHLTSCFRYKEC